MNTVYISMPITGFNLQERVETANRYRERILKTYNCSKVITPFDNELGGLVPDKSYGWYMGKDVEYIIDNVDTIFFINGWENSKGACLEEQLGKIYGKTLIYESDEIMIQHKKSTCTFKDYYKFPLMIDECCGNVIAQPDDSGYMMAWDWIGNEWIDENPIDGQKGEKLANNIVRFLNGQTDDRPNFLWSKDPSGDPTIICMNGVPCIEIRGWSNLVVNVCHCLETKRAEEIQDEFRDWIIDKLNGNV